MLHCTFLSPYTLTDVCFLVMAAAHKQYCLHSSAKVNIAILNMEVATYLYDLILFLTDRHTEVARLTGGFVLGHLRETLFTFPSSFNIFNSQKQCTVVL